MATKKTTTKKKSTTTKKRREHAKAVAAADQQNARLRDKRKAAEDGMRVSERAMATSGKKPSSKRKASGAKAKGKLSGLDAAAQILAVAKEPMSCKAIVEQAIEQKLWAPGGRTPHATLYSAMLREIQHKGKDARFEKVERGRFQLRKGAS